MAACNIARDHKGQIQEVYAPNKKSSELFKAALEFSKNELGIENTNNYLKGSNQVKYKEESNLTYEDVEKLFESNPELANSVYEELGIKGNKKNSFEVFSEIEKTTNREDLKKIAQLLKSNSNSKITTILFIDSNDSVMGMNHQSFKNNKINSIVRILDEKTLSEFDKGLLGNYTEETVLHEEIHRYTTIVTMLAEKYNNEELKELLNEKELKFLRELQDLHKIYKENGGYFKLQEFITYGLTDEKEIEVLKKIKIQNETLFSKLIKSLLDLLGVKESNLYDLLFKSFSDYYTNALNTENYKEDYSEFENKYLKPITPQQKQQAIEYYINKQSNSNLTSQQKEAISDLKETDKRWQKYSDEDIQRFIDSIFPDSKVKDIVYHGTYFSDAFSEEDLSKRNRYFTDTLEYAKGIARKTLSPYILNKSERLKYRLKEVKVIFALLNIQNPQYSNRIAQSMEIDNTKDSVVGKEIEDYSNKIDNIDVGQTNSYVVFEPEQIYILNSDKAIQDMNSFIEDSTTNQSPIEQALLDYAAKNAVVEKKKDDNIVGSFMQESSEISFIKKEIQNLRDFDGNIPAKKTKEFNILSKKLRFLQLSSAQQILKAVEDFTNLNNLTDKQIRYVNSLIKIRDSFFEIISELQDLTSVEFVESDFMKIVDSKNQSIADIINNNIENQNNIINKNSEKAAKELGIEINKEYSANELDNFIQKYGSKQVKFIWNLIKNVAEKLGVKTRFSLEGKTTVPTGYAGHYLQGKIDNRASLLQTPDVAARVIVHELIHGVTNYIINAVKHNKTEVLKLLTQKQINAVKKLSNLLKQLQSDENTKDYYGSKNEDEILAELTHDGFVEALQNKKLNFVEKLLDYILEILGIETNAYNEALVILQDLIENPILYIEKGFVDNNSLYSKEVEKLEVEKLEVEKLFDSNPELANSVYEELGFDNLITPQDKIVFGHPTIGKSYLKNKGENRFITLDDDYIDEVNSFIDTNRGSETRQEYKGRKPKEYNQFMLDLFDRLKVQAKREGKQLFVSNTNILKERMSDFDKVITIPKDEFKKRFDARGATYGFEDWKSDIDATIAKVDKNKVITTTGYLSDLFITPQQKQQAIEYYINKNKTDEQVIDEAAKNAVVEESNIQNKPQKLYPEIKVDISNNPSIYFNSPIGWEIQLSNLKNGYNLSNEQLNKQVKKDLLESLLRTQGNLKKSSRELYIKYHPDKGGNAEHFIFLKSLVDNNQELLDKIDYYELMTNLDKELRNSFYSLQYHLQNIKDDYSQDYHKTNIEKQLSKIRESLNSNTYKDLIDAIVDRKSIKEGFKYVMNKEYRNLVKSPKSFDFFISALQTTELTLNDFYGFIKDNNSFSSEQKALIETMRNLIGDDKTIKYLKNPYKDLYPNLTAEVRNLLLVDKNTHEITQVLEGINLYKDFFDNLFKTTNLTENEKKEHLISIIAHEFLHIATLGELAKKDSPVYKFIKSEYDKLSNFKTSNFYKNLQEDEKKELEYTLKDEKEFAASLFNSKVLKNYINQKQNTLQKIWSEILKLLGIKEDIHSKILTNLNTYLSNLKSIDDHITGGKLSDIIGNQNFSNVNYKLKLIESLEKLSLNRTTLRLNSKEKPYIETNIRKTLNGKGVTNQQIDLLFDYMKSNNLQEAKVEDVIKGLKETYGFEIKIETVTEKTEHVKQINATYFEIDGVDYAEAFGNWFKNNGTEKIPYKEYKDALDKYNQQNIEETPTQVHKNLSAKDNNNEVKYKEEEFNLTYKDIEKLFESNPELANSVYEELGFDTAQLKEDIAVTNAFLTARQHEEAKRINSGEFDDIKLDLKTELQNIIDNSSNPLFVELAKSIQNKESLKTIKAFSTQKPFKTKEGFEPAAAYQAETQRLILFLGNTVRFENKERKYQYLLHELVHHFVDRELVLTNSKQAENIRQLFKYTKYQLTKAGKQNLYGLTNFHEFVTEALTNPDFQKELKTLQVPEQFLTKSFSIFDYFLELVSKILGNNKSVLEAVIFQASDIFELQEYKKSLSITLQQKQQAIEYYYNKERQKYGWEYQELSINTPQIENSIGSSHNPFSQYGGNYIGHARVWINKNTGELDIQEIQADGLQKARKQSFHAVNFNEDELIKKLQASRDLKIEC